MNEKNIFKNAWLLRKEKILKNKLQAFRLIHDLADGFPGLTLEVYPHAFHGIIKNKAYLSQLSSFEVELKKVAQELWNNDDCEFYWWDYSERQVRAIHESPLREIELIENNLKYEIHLGKIIIQGFF